MIHNELKEKIYECLSNVGIEMDYDDNNLNQYLQDSLVFISFVIELEEYFGVEIDETFFTEETFKTIDSLQNVVLNLLN